MKIGSRKSFRKRECSTVSNMVEELNNTKTKMCPFSSYRQVSDVEDRLSLLAYIKYIYVYINIRGYGNFTNTHTFSHHNTMA